MYKKALALFLCVIGVSSTATAETTFDTSTLNTIGKGVGIKNLKGTCEFQVDPVTEDLSVTKCALEMKTKPPTCEHQQPTLAGQPVSLPPPIASVIPTNIAGAASGAQVLNANNPVSPQGVMMPQPMIISPTNTPQQFTVQQQTAPVTPTFTAMPQQFIPNTAQQQAVPVGAGAATGAPQALGVAAVPTNTITQPTQLFAAPTQMTAGGNPQANAFGNIAAPQPPMATNAASVVQIPQPAFALVPGASAPTAPVIPNATALPQPSAALMSGEITTPAEMTADPAAAVNADSETLSAPGETLPTGLEEAAAAQNLQGQVPGEGETAEKITGKIPDEITGAEGAATETLEEPAVPDASAPDSLDPTNLIGQESEVEAESSLNPEDPNIVPTE